MNPLSLTGAFIISLALLFYGVSSISIQRFRIITPSVLITLTLGVLLDITAVGFMIAGSGLLHISLHGFLGFVAMLSMIIDAVLIWRIYLKQGLDAEISNAVATYTKYAYVWWLIAYFTGSILVIW
jgi:hypothetical protein